MLISVRALFSKDLVKNYEKILKQMTKEQDFEFSFEIPSEVSSENDAPKVFGELDAMSWAVINAEECAVSGLTYEQAQKFRGWLEREGLSGLCIVTNEVGARLVALQNAR